MVLKVGIVGCGNIGLELARFVHQHRAFTLQAVSDMEPEPIRRLLIEIQPDQPEILDLAGLVDAVDLIVETANKEAAGAILGSPAARHAGKKALSAEHVGFVRKQRSR